MYFVYSTHKTREAAEDALDDYFANGEICAAERPYITKLGKRWAVMFPGA